MSFYWRWVVVRTAVAALAGIPTVAANAHSILTWGPSHISSLSELTSLAAFAAVALAELWVLRSKFQAIRASLFLLLTIAPFAIVTLFLLATARIFNSLLDIANDSSGETSAEAITLVEEIAIVGSVAIVVIPILLLPWLAVRKVACGFWIWALGITGAVVAYVLVAFAMPYSLGHSFDQPDYSTWIGTFADYATTLTSDFSYALVSGIGVARLRPKPEPIP